MKKLQNKYIDFKNNHFKLFTSLIILICMTFPCIVEKFIYDNEGFRYERFILYTIFSISIALITSFGIKKSSDFIYRYRYLLGISLFAICVTLGINYSSSGVYNYIIQPNNNVSTANPILGQFRYIKSDEYVVGTPSALSQYYNNFSLINDDMMASSVIVNFYPNFPNFSISLLSSPGTIGFLLLPLKNACSFSHLFIWFFAFFATFEMLSIITKKKKMISLIGTIIILFSPTVLWWGGINFIGYIAALFDILYLFINSKSWKKKLLYSIIFGWLGSCYIMILYPAWQISYGYLFLGLGIWLLFINKDKLKWRDLLYLIPCLTVVVGLVLPNYLSSRLQYELVMNTVYPGSRSEIGGTGWEMLFAYIPSLFLTVSDIGNPCEFNQFLSLYPLPLILGVIQFVRNVKSKKNDSFLNTMLLLSIFFSIFMFIPCSFFAKITLLSMSLVSRVANVQSVICLLIIIRLISNYQNNLDYKKHRFIIIITSILIPLTAIYIMKNYIINSFIGYDYLNTTKCVIAFIFIFILCYLLICNTKKSITVLSILLVGFSIFQFLTTLPLVVGIDVYTEKPISKEIQSIREKDDDSIWLVVSNDFTKNGYIWANGVKLINSTNYFPNYENWDKIDKDRTYDNVYNRYAHIIVSLTTDESNFELLGPDYIRLNLNSNDICTLDLGYIVSDNNIDLKKTKTTNILTKIYDEDGMYIYKTSCEKGI